MASLGLAVLTATLASCSPADDGPPSSAFDGRVGAVVLELTIGDDLAASSDYQFAYVSSIEAAGDDGVWVIDGADSSSPRIRRFGAEGEISESLGRRGDGPGEFTSPDDLVQLDDGTVVVRDPGQLGRVTLFGADGGVETWSMGPVRQVLNSGEGVRLDSDGLLWLRFTGSGRLRSERAGPRFLRATPLGITIDTVVPPPFPETDPLGVDVVTSSGGRRSYRLPYQPRGVRAWHPDGIFLVGRTDSAAFTLLAPVTREQSVRVDADDYEEVGRLRIRDRRAAVTRQERSDLRAELQASVDAAAADGRAAAVPELPRQKPIARSVFFENDTLLVVIPHLESERAEARWREPPTIDLYRFPEGAFIGRLGLPPGAAVSEASMHLDGDRIWIAMMSDMGVPYIARLRISWP